MININFRGETKWRHITNSRGDLNHRQIGVYEATPGSAGSPSFKSLSFSLALNLVIAGWRNVLSIPPIINLSQPWLTQQTHRHYNYHLNHLLISDLSFYPIGNKSDHGGKSRRFEINSGSPKRCRPLQQKSFCSSSTRGTAVCTNNLSESWRRKIPIINLILHESNLITHAYKFKTAEFEPFTTCSQVFAAPEARVN